jgi:hypothetical protein
MFERVSRVSPAALLWAGLALLAAFGAGALIAHGYPFPHLDSALYFQVSRHLANGDGSSFAH